MSDLNEALETLRTHARGYRAIIKLADALGDLASVEQAVGEANARLEAMRGEVADAEARAAARREELDVAVASQEANLAAARAQSEGIVQAAIDSAGNLKRDTAAKIDAMLRDAQGRVDALALREAELNASVALTEEKLADTEARLATAEAALADMRKKLGV